MVEQNIFISADETPIWTYIHPLSVLQKLIIDLFTEINPASPSPQPGIFQRVQGGNPECLVAS
jgi:hypothetical protein